MILPSNLDVTVYQITYTLNSPGQDYEELHDAIRSLGDSVRALDACWFVDTTESATDIRDLLGEETGTNDSIIVSKKSESGVTWATSNASDAGEWLSDH